MIINQYAGSPRLGMEFRPHWMGRQWVARGHEVIVVTGDRSHLRDQNPPAGASTQGGLAFKTLRTTPYSGNAAARFANILSFRYQLFRAMPELERWQPTVVIASSTHPMDVRPAATLAKRSSALFVYEVHDLWPLTPKVLGGMSGRHPMIAWMQREEDFGYRTCDLAVSILPGTQRYMAQHGLDQSKWIHIPNGSTPPAVGEELPVEVHTRLDDLRRRYRRVLVYAGGLTANDGLEPLFENLRPLSVLGIGVVVAGDGPQRGIFESEWGSEPNIAFLGRLPRSAIMELLQQCDGAYAGLRASNLYEHGVSLNKMYDYMFAGLPVIENISTTSNLTALAECGWVTSPSSPMELRRALEEFASCLTEELQALGSNGESYARKNLDEAVLADRTVQAFDARIALQQSQDVHSVADLPRESG